MGRALVTTVFGLFALGAGVGVVDRLERALEQPGWHSLAVLGHSLLRLGVVTAFAFFVLVRESPRRPSRDPVAFVACAAAVAAVLALHGPTGASSTALVVVGDLVALAACAWLLVSVLALGRCFGVLPEVRGLVMHGPYRIVRHPVYLGELGACVGLCIAAPTVWNGGVVVVFVAAQAVRMRMEERALGNEFAAYEAYAARTPALLPSRDALLTAARFPMVALIRGLDRLALVLDSSPISRSTGATRIRRALAVLFLLYGLVLSVIAVLRGGLPSWGPLLMVMLAAALFSNRGGRFVRDWLPVLLGFFAYSLAGQFASGLDFTVHYTPQIDAERALAFGAVPTIWLQDLLYNGTTGALEVFAMTMYLSHFFAPVLLGFYLWWKRLRDGFTQLMFGLLTVSILAEITFVLAPTAPPWLAAQQGLLPPVDHVIKQGLYDLDLTAAASFYGDPDAYNIVAAIPSLHAAWPVIGLLVARRWGLPRWVILLQAAQLVGVVFAIVYTGEHYLVDALVGGVYAVVAWAIVQRAFGRVARPALTRVPAAAAPVLVAEPIDTSRLAKEATG
jgi:protein-S-isoprenylcysteine O-methyltransferase Ste14